MSARSWSRSFALLLSIAALGVGSTVASDNSIVVPPNPPGCPAGYRCIPIPVYAQMTAIKVRLEDRVAEFEARKRVVRWHVGCGPVAAGIVTPDYDAKVVPSIACGLLWGY